VKQNVLDFTFAGSDAYKQEDIVGIDSDQFSGLWKFATIPSNQR